MITFGVGTLSVLTNNLFTGCVATTGASGAPAANIAVSSGLVMIDGITAIVSAQTVSYTQTTGGINTGSGLMLYSYIDAASTITATCAIASATDPINTSIGIPTAICPLAKFSFGTGAVSVSTIVAWSGGSATKTIGKVQNVKIDISIENAQMRGGGDVYPVDTQFFNGKVEGSFEWADDTATQLLFMGGSYLSGGNNSGTWTLSGNCKPEPVSLSFTNLTNGITGTYTVLRAYLHNLGSDFKRTDYMMPSYSFVAQANIKNHIMTVQA